MTAASKSPASVSGCRTSCTMNRTFRIFALRAMAAATASASTSAPTTCTFGYRRAISRVNRPSPHPTSSTDQVARSGSMDNPPSRSIPSNQRLKSSRSNPNWCSSRRRSSAPRSNPPLGSGLNGSVAEALPSSRSSMLASLPTLTPTGCGGR